MEPPPSSSPAASSSGVLSWGPPSGSGSPSRTAVTLRPRVAAEVSTAGVGVEGGFGAGDSGWGTSVSAWLSGEAGGGLGVRFSFFFFFLPFPLRPCPFFFPFPLPLRRGGGGVSGSPWGCALLVGPRSSQPCRYWSQARKAAWGSGLISSSWMSPSKASSWVSRVPSTVRPEVLMDRGPRLDAGG